MAYCSSRKKEGVEIIGTIERKEGRIKFMCCRCSKTAKEGEGGEGRGDSDKEGKYKHKLSLSRV